MDLKDRIVTLKGVGEKTASLYENVGISDIDDLIHYYPRDYVKYESTTRPCDFETDKIYAFKANVSTRPLTRRLRKLQITTCKLSCEGMLVTATWFRMPYLSKSLEVGKCYVFRGKVSAQGDHFHVEQPAIYKEEDYIKLCEKIAPIYSLTKGLSNNSVTKSIKNAFDGLSEDSYEDGLYDIHFPDSMEALYAARNKLVYDELLLFVLRLRLLKDDNESAYNDFDIIEVSQTSRVIERLPYRLTNAQLSVWEDIKRDLSSNKSMSRLVQGDVGSGKTIISILASIMVAANGYQAAVMAPTEILASQHYDTFKNIIAQNKLDIDVVLLTGSMTEKTKRLVREDIENGIAKIIIGTHALIQEKVNYHNLALVVTDEQHRFGVNQRQMLTGKNSTDNVHVLVMSATPIPRTLSLIMYGDLSISIIDEVPAHKLPIKNAIVDEGYRKKAYEFMQKEIAAGHQVYIICPLVEESEGLEAKDVVSYCEEITSIFPESIRIGMIHGKMRPKDKQRVMDDFANNNINILVSTTVVEVGVNVPNATVMMIENADRFGLAQLHQLRGRIGRGKNQSYCIFMSSNKSKKTLERLEILGKTNDGFKIAEEDLRQRGPGDMFGLRQSGDMSFKLADVFTDAALLERAAQDADKLLRDDPKLEKPENAKLKERLEETIAKSSIGQTI